MKFPTTGFNHSNYRYNLCKFFSTLGKYCMDLIMDILFQKIQGQTKALSPDYLRSLSAAKNV